MAKTILLIEDKENVRESLSDVLISMGYNAVQAVDGTDGLKKLNELMPDLVVTDVGLDGIDGYEVCRQIKKVRKLPVTVLIYSGTFGNVDPAKAKKAGAKDFIVKGRDPDELLKAIKKYLQ